MAISGERVRRLNCPVRAIHWYIDKTRTVRGDFQQFFITSKKPYRPAAKSTIAGWLVDVIVHSDAVIGTGIPRAHSSRSMSSSWAFAKGISIQEIINTVSWKTESTFIKTYMKDVRTQSSITDFASAVLNSQS